MATRRATASPSPRTLIRLQIADSLLWSGLDHDQGSDGFEDGLEARVETLLELVDSPFEVAVLDRYPPELNEGAHDLDVYGNRPLTPQHAREHRYSVLGERLRWLSTAAPGT